MIIEKNQQPSVNSPARYGDYVENFGKRVKGCPMGRFVEDWGFLLVSKDFETAPNAVKIRLYFI
jgi:hypothetical protein